MRKYRDRLFLLRDQNTHVRLFRESEPTPDRKDFEQVLLQTITQSPGLNAPSLSNRLGRSLRTTQRYLKSLTDKGQITFCGFAQKGGYYPLE